MKPRMDPTEQPTDVLVIGAGMAGLIAAAELQRAGRRVVVLDKSRGVGGRLASRRFDGATFDHGAQFITTRNPRFAAVLEQGRQFWDLAYLRACSFPTSGLLSSALASRTMKGKDFSLSRRKSMNPVLDFSKSSPRASRSCVFTVTLGSSWMFAGPLASAKKRQPAFSSSLLILMRAAASFMRIFRSSKLRSI